MTIKTIYGVHVELRELELVKWVKDKVNNGEFSPTMVFRDAVKELKTQDDILNNKDIENNVKELKRKLENWQYQLEQRTEFIEKKGLMDQFLEFYNSKKKTEIPKIEIESIEKLAHMIKEKDQSLDETKLNPEDRNKILGVAQ